MADVKIDIPLIPLRDVVVFPGIVTTLFTAYFLARHLTSLVVLNNNKEIKI